MATRGMTEYRANGVDYTINDQNVANEFSTSVKYGIGEHVYYQGDLYIFIAEHAAGSWNSEHVKKAEISQEVSDLKCVLEANESNIVGTKNWKNISYNNFEPTWESGNRVSNAGDEFNLFLYKKIIVTLINTSTTHSVRVDLYYENKNAANSITLSAQEPVVDIPMDRGYRYMRIIVLGSTDISPDIIKDLVTISATGMCKTLSDTSNALKGLQDLYNIHSISWAQKAGNAHSSNNDRLAVNIERGETFRVAVMTSDGSSVGGAVAGVGGISTGQLYEYTATDDIDSIGVYLDRVETDCTVTVMVVQDGLMSGTTSDGGEIPAYWKEEIDEKLNEVALLQSYETGVTFGFVSDIHWETNWKKSPKLIGYISNNSPVRVWINGGDTASGDGGDGELQIKWLFESMGRFTNSCERFYSVIGNHDDNANDGVSARLSDSVLHNIIMPHYDNVTFGGKTYYWFDYAGTRFVCLDNGRSYATDPTQIAWAKSIIDNSEIPVVIVLHIIFVAASDETPCGFYNELIQAIGVNSNVKFIIAGHLHDDRYFIGNTGIPVILLNTDSIFGDDGTSRNQNTLTEQCLSIVTADYNSKKITITRIGSVKTGFVVNY